MNESERLAKVAAGEIADTTGWNVDTTKCPVCGRIFEWYGSDHTGRGVSVWCSNSKCGNLTAENGTEAATYAEACKKLYDMVEKDL